MICAKCSLSVWDLCLRNRALCFAMEHKVTLGDILDHTLDARAGISVISGGVFIRVLKGSDVILMDTVADK